MDGFINTNIPFLIYAEASVEYDGRAYSTLDVGNYLVIYKKDGSLLIHGCDLSKPLNYQGPKSKLEYKDNILISRNKKETISIRIQKIHNYVELNDWSSNKIQISKTEQELVEKLCDDIRGYLGISGYVEIYTEYRTDNGPIDVLVKNDGKIHIIEAKRKKATKNNCVQLKKYQETFGEDTIGYIAAPDIGDNALEYLEANGGKYIRVDFD